jgi:hypothetical protein
MSDEMNDENVEGGFGTLDWSEEVDKRRSATAPIEPPVATFDRAMAPAFIEKLKAEYQADTGDWWRDILRDKSVVIASRGTSLDVYWFGARLFHVIFTNGALSISTHEKYLLDPALKDQISMRNGRFGVEALRTRGFIETYAQGRTLEALKKAAGPYMGAEKRGCHEIAVHNSSVIDCEIGFPRPRDPAGNLAPESPGRADIACLEEHGQDARLVFWEAKIFANKELRSDNGQPKVCDQIARYRRYLQEHQGPILESYTKVAKNLVALRDMGWVREQSSLVQEVAAGTRRLVMGETPKVGLLVFGFDAAQRDGKDWSKHRKVLCDRLGGASNFMAVGSPKGLTLPTRG